jgi:branched-chain amino acid transport system substrate-binding protein
MMRIGGLKHPALAAVLVVGLFNNASAQTTTALPDNAEIKIGNLMPYSGPASAFGVIGRVEAAYANMINDRGGINGRKVRFITYDDAYSPPKAVEQVRRLVENDDVLFVVSPIGTATSSAIQRYLNINNVPGLFIGSPSPKFGDPKTSPWTIGFQPSSGTEIRIYVSYLLKQKPDAKIALLYQNDDYGKDYRSALREALGDKADTMIVAEASYESTDPTVDSQIVKLKASGADTLFNISSPKFTAQAIRKVSELNWKPVQFIYNGTTSKAGVMAPAGYANAQGVLSAVYLKDASDPQWQTDPGVQRFAAFLEKYYPGANKDNNLLLAYGYAVFQVLEVVLKNAGNDLSRDNIMKQATSLHRVPSDMLIDGITASTEATNRFPIRQLQMMKFEGEGWTRFGPVLSDAQ